MPLRPLADPRRTNRSQLILPPATDGVLRSADDQRVAVLPASFATHLAAEIDTAFDESARHVLYMCGYDWALRDMVRLSRELGEEFGGGADLDLWQLDARFVMERWWSQLAIAGWGWCAFDFSSLNRGFLFAEVKQSAVAASARNTTQPACHLYAGLFAGALSFFERTERHAVEFQCAAQGAPTCRFAIGAGSQVDEIESWRLQRVAPDEIRRRLA